MSDELDRELLIRLDVRVAELARAIERHDTAHEDIEMRLRRLEQWQWRTTGVAAVAAVLGSSIISPIVRTLLGGGGG